MDKFFLFTLSSSILFSCISISLSQGFLFLSLVVYIIFYRKHFKVDSPFIISFAIFLFYIISTIYHLIFFNGVEFKSSELKDIFLFSAFIIIQSLNKEQIKKIEKVFFILILLILITGFISIFSPIRLSKLLTMYFISSKSYIYAHPYGEILGVNVHYPIGMMNTHLTFGGFLLLFYPFVFFKFIVSYIEKKSRLAFTFMFLVYSIVFLFNNARSALIGSFIAILIGFIILLNQKQRNLFKILILFCFILLSLFISLIYLKDKSPALSRVINPILGEEKITDSGRTFIWNSTFPLIEKNLFLGIGPGNYNIEIEKSRKEISANKKETLFFNEVTQRGHAHNDYLHLAAISGIFTPLFYIILLGFISKKLFLEQIDFKEKILFLGLIAFYFAGIYQCYFQDDEVVILFWYLVGLLNSKLKAENFQNIEQTL